MLPQRINLIAYSTLAVIICYIDRVNISVAIIPMQEQFGWSDSEVGFIFSSFYLGYMLTQWPWGDTYLISLEVSVF